MEYRTTKLTTIKSYPTYQFHAFTASDKLGAEDVFKICVLETLRWLRARLNNYPAIPEEFVAPEPDKYKEFSLDRLTSFNINIGATIDCTYIRDKGVWSFRMTETDAGENLGTPAERLPVNGRTFRTEISFIMHSDCVEAGVRTVCSEPSDSTAPCSVFRPTVVKALANDPNVGFVSEGFRINGSAMQMTNRAEFGNLEKLYNSDELDMPIVLVADSGYSEAGKSGDSGREDKAFDIDRLTAEIEQMFSGVYLSEQFGKSDMELPPLSFKDDVLKSIKNSSVKVSADENEDAADNKKEAVKEEMPTAEPGSEPEKLPVFDVQSLAIRALGFAVVCFVSGNCYDMLRNKLGIKLSDGGIVICSHKAELARYQYDAENMDKLLNDITTELKELTKRGEYHFGNVLFYSDARLSDLSEKLNRNMSLEEELKVCRQENSALRSKLNELTQRNNDMQISAENSRVLRKQLKDAEDEIGDLKVYIENFNKQAAEKESAYRKAAELINFYRQRSFDAAYFPTNKEDVCAWAAKNFSDTIIITPRAEASLRKYSAPFDTAVLCDGIYYLNAYEKYRRGELTEEMFSLYSHNCNWEVTGSGKEAMKMFKSDYSVSVDGRPFSLDMHIKHGVSTQALIRIYFTRSDELRKIIIGYMPGHLATVTQST